MVIGMFQQSSRQLGSKNLAIASLDFDFAEKQIAYPRLAVVR
jgi:hypothetical protein